MELSGSRVSFISEYEYMNPSYRPSMEDATVILPALPLNNNVFLAALMDGHGGIIFELLPMSYRLWNGLACRLSSSR